MNRKRGMAFLTAIIITLLVVILLAITNPRQENHIAAIKNSLAAGDVLTNVINRGLLAVKPPAYKSLVLFSYTEWDKKISTIGVCGYVWVDVRAFK